MNPSGISVCVGGLAFPEGPDVLDDGSVVFVEIFRGMVSRWMPGSDRTSVVADTGGGPNAVVRGGPGQTTGELYLTQNGGVAGTWRSTRQVPAGIQVVGADGQLRYLATRIGSRDLVAPNDLCFDADGTLFFTDPGEGYDPAHPRATGCVHAISSDGGERTFEVGQTFPNGIAWHAGQLYWAESYTCRIMGFDTNGSPKLVAQLAPGHVPDGFKLDAAGVMYVTTTATGGLDIVLPDGTIRGLHLADDAYTTNCTLASDGALYVTDAAGARPDDPTGRLWRIEPDTLALVVRGGDAA